MKTYSLLDLLKLLINKWWICLLALIIGAAAGYGYAKTKVSRSYTATATLSVAHNYAQLGQASRQNIGASAYDLVQSDILLQTTIRDLISDSAITKHAQKRVHFSTGDIDVNSPANSVLINITAHNSSSHRAVRIVNALARSTRRLLPEVLPAAGNVVVAKKATSTVQVSGPSSKRYAMIGGLALFVITAFLLLWKDIKDKLK
ncbi:Wzz/FepE/Etk N-terminal domain-containing protein [Oenococcus alcoholitolerans]|uniref:Wzz/FepE/Etk N-terminal domain-containing protein n=1 Tax=Oenococcus alcoholitolerans TaxID=931074 RepID=UPI003F72EF13